MTTEYSPDRFNRAPLQPEYCKARVASGAWHSKQCSRKVWKDGWCKQHHPETRQKRLDEFNRKYKSKRARDARRYELDRLRDKIVEEALAVVADGVLTQAFKDLVKEYRTLEDTPVL
jgi:hypothetical protein